VSDLYGVKDAACPLSTRGGEGGGSSPPHSTSPRSPWSVAHARAPTTLAHRHPISTRRHPHQHFPTPARSVEPLLRHSAPNTLPSPPPPWYAARRAQIDGLAEAARLWREAQAPPPSSSSDDPPHVVTRSKVEESARAGKSRSISPLTPKWTRPCRRALTPGATSAPRPRCWLRQKSWRARTPRARARGAEGARGARGAARRRGWWWRSSTSLGCCAPRGAGRETWCVPLIRRVPPTQRPHPRLVAWHGCLMRHYTCLFLVANQS